MEELTKNTEDVEKKKVGNENVEDKKTRRTEREREKRKKRLEEAEKFLASYEKEDDRRGLVDVIVRFCEEYDALFYEDRMLSADNCYELLIELKEEISLREYYARVLNDKKIADDEILRAFRGWKEDNPKGSVEAFMKEVAFKDREEFEDGNSSIFLCSRSKISTLIRDAQMEALDQRFLKVIRQEKEKSEEELEEELFREPREFEIFEIYDTHVLKRFAYKVCEGFYKKRLPTVLNELIDAVKNNKEKSHKKRGEEPLFRDKKGSRVLYDELRKGGKK